MQIEKDPMMVAIQESLQEKIGPSFEVRRILRLRPLATDVLLNSKDRGPLRARVYNAKEKDFDSFRDAWESHRRLITDIDHPQLMPLLELEQLGQTLALVGQPTSGLDLGTYCRRVGPMQPAFATRLLLKIVQLYQVLYEQGGHNLNLALDNVFFGPTGEIQLSHYGLWNFEVELADLWGLKELLDPGFLSPEHITGKTLTVSSEIYQLGILYFRMVTGRLPFTGEYEDIREAHLNQAAPNPQTYRDNISIGLARILAKAMAKKANERFWTLADFQQTLNLLLPLEERHAYAEADDHDIVDADRERFEEQLEQAKDQYQTGDYETALHTVGAVLMMAGNYQPAIELAAKIRADKNEGQTKKYWDDARYILDMGQPEAALEPLHRILDLNPAHEPTLQLHAQLFPVLETQQTELGQPLPVQAYMEQAGVAKTLEDFTLAENLWYMVLLSPSPQESHLFELMQMQKKVARQELETLQALNKSGAKLPSAKGAGSESSGSSFRDEELEELFAPISPAGESQHDEMMVEDELFDDLSNALDEEPFDITADQTMAPGEDDPEPLMANETGPIDQLAPTQLLPHLSFESESETEQLAPIPPVSKSAPPLPPPQVSAPVAEKPPAPVAAPQETPASDVSKDHPKKAKRPLPLIIGGIAALILIVVTVFIVMRMNASKAFRKAGEQAYLTASDVEASGQWETALAAWRKAEVDFPGFRDIPERAKTLEYKIQAQKEDIARYSERARNYLDEGNYYGNGTENAVAYLRQILSLDENHPGASAMFKELADLEMTRARSLFEEEKVVEAREAYTQLVQANPDFADPGFETDVDAWLEEKITGPQLEKIDRAIKRKRWDQAFKLSDELRDSMKHPAVLNERWAAVYSEFETKLAAAESKGNKSQMLAQIDMLARIRPEDQQLINRRNELNREINQSKITNLENAVEKALKAKKYATAGRSAQQLQRLDSENGLAKSSLDEVRNHYLRKIREHRNSNVRVAHATYKDLVKVFNWKSYRQEMNALGKRVGEFDRQVQALRNGSDQTYEKQTTNAVRVAEQFSDFSQDPAYGAINQIKDQLNAEKRRLSAMQDWEKTARNNTAKSYDEILQYLQKAGPFSKTYGKKQKSSLITRYRNLNENYEGAVTLVIRSAKGLPKEGSGLNRAPEASCQLTVGGKTYNTAVINNAYNPTWDYTCNIAIKPGQSLTFSVFDSDRGNKKDLLGSINLAKMPKSTRGMVLKHANGWSITIDVRRER